MKKLAIWLLLLLFLIGGIVLYAWAQSDYRAKRLIVSGRGARIDGRGGIPLFWDGFIEGNYAGTTRDVIHYNYTGTGHNLIEMENSGTDVFVVDENGNITTVGTVTVTGLELPDTDASHHLSFIWNENDTADRTLNFLVAGGTRSLTVEANSLLNQDLTTDANPTFAGVNADGINVGITAANEIDTDSGNLVLDSNGGTVEVTDILLIGDGTNNCTFDPASGPDYNGTGRPTRYIEIKPTDLCPEDTSPGVGTLTSAYDETNYETYTRFDSSGTDQTLNVMAKFVIPADFSAWAASNAITVRVRSSDIANATMVIYMYQNDNTVDSGVNGASILPSGNDTWEAKNDQPAGSYSAGDYAKIRFALQGDSADQCDVGIIRLEYLAAY